MRTFVSTKVLTLMQFIPPGTNDSAQVKAFLQQCQRCAFCALILFFRAYQHLNLFGKQATDGGRAPRCEDFGLLYRGGAETDGEVLLLYGVDHGPLHVTNVLHVLYVKMGLEAYRLC